MVSSRGFEGTDCIHSILQRKSDSPLSSSSFWLPLSKGYSLNRQISRQPHSLLLPFPLLTVLVSNKLASRLILQILFYCLSLLNLTALCCLIIHSACLTWAVTMGGWFL